MKFATILAALLLSTSAMAYTVTGFLSGQYQGKSAGGMTGTVCVYNVMGKEAHVFIGIGVCPVSMQFNQ